MPQQDYASKSPLLETDLDLSKGHPKYSEEEELYLGRLQARLQSAVMAREQERVEFDGMTFSTWWDMNEKGANTYVEPKKNKGDSSYQSGTIRQKLLAFLAAVNNLNLSPDISAFDEDNLEVAGLGQAMEDVMLKTDEMDPDEEKKMLRQYELLKQGTVFIEEVWDEKFVKDKRIKGSMKFNGKIDGLTWTEKLKRYFAKPSRNVVSSLMVYLGDIRQYFLPLQPYLFTVDIRDYQETKAIYGNWERWCYVSKILNPQTNMDQGRSMYDNNWRLLNATENGQCEIIKYQDKWNNEFAIVINGVLMTPVGLPFPWGYNEYNMEQQNLEPIHTHFAYGNSVVHKLKTQVGVYDEMIRMAVLKTQRSYAPSTINLSGRVLSSRIFDPGKMNYGIPQGSIVPTMEGINNGIQQAEIAMFELLQKDINGNSVNPVSAGQQPGGDPTATQVLEVQRQAKQVLGLTIGACSLLEWKISWLRLYNILKNWFNPVDEVVDEARNMLVTKYRIVNIEQPIEGEGMGVHMVIPKKGGPDVNLEDPQHQEMRAKYPMASDKAISVRMLEDKAKKISGKPTKMTFVDPDVITSSKLAWQIVIRPREKNTNEISKLLFRAELADAQFFAQDLNIQYLEDKFAHVWQENPNKLFKRDQNAGFGQPQSGGVGGPGPAPSVPKGAGAAGKGLANALKQ